MSSGPIVNVALVQMSCSDDKSDNVSRTAEHIRTAKAKGAHVVCLQELFATPYPCQREDYANFELAEPLPGPTSSAIANAAQESQVVVIGSFFERRDAGIYHNTAVVFAADGQAQGVYRKMHIPDDPCYFEKFYFTPGDLGFRAIQTRPASIGVAVCWDQWFPEAARLMALCGAKILFYPTAIGWLKEDDDPAVRRSQVNAWTTMMRSHAIANGCFVVAVNRVGPEGDLTFWGASFVADPWGNVILECGRDAEEVAVAACDLSHVETARRQWPFLRDRRVDAYRGLTERYLDVPTHD